MTEEQYSSLGRCVAFRLKVKEAQIPGIKCLLDAQDEGENADQSIQLQFMRPCTRRIAESCFGKVDTEAKKPTPMLQIHRSDFEEKRSI